MGSVVALVGQSLPQADVESKEGDGGSEGGFELFTTVRRAGGITEGFADTPSGLGNRDEWKPNEKILEPGTVQAVSSNRDQGRTESQGAARDPQPPLGPGPLFELGPDPAVFEPALESFV